MIDATLASTSAEHRPIGMDVAQHRPMGIEQQPSCSGTQERRTASLDRSRAHSSSSPMSVSVRLPADCVRRLAAIVGRHSAVLSTLGIRRLQSSPIDETILDCLQVSDSAPVTVVTADTTLQATCSNDSRPGSDDTRVESGLGSSRASTDNHHATTSSLSSQADSALAMAQDQHLVRRAITTNFQTKVPPSSSRWTQPSTAPRPSPGASSSVVANMQQMVSNQAAHSANEPSLLVGLLTSSGVDSSGAAKLESKINANHMNPGTPSGGPPPKRRKKPAPPKNKQAKTTPMQPPMGHVGYGAPMMPGGDPSAAFMSHPYYRRPPPHPSASEQHMGDMQQGTPRPQQYAYEQQAGASHAGVDAKPQWTPQQPSSPWTSSTHSATPTDDRASSVCSASSVLSPSTLNSHPPNDMTSALSPTTTQHVAETIDAVLSGRASVYGQAHGHYDARTAEEKFYKQQVMTQHHQEQQQRLMQQHQMQQHQHHQHQLQQQQQHMAQQQQQQMAQQQARAYAQAPQQAQQSQSYAHYGGGYPAGANSGYPAPAQQYYEQQPQYPQQQPAMHGYPAAPAQHAADYDPYAKPVATLYTQGYPEQKAPLMRHEYPQQMSQ